MDTMCNARVLLTRGNCCAVPFEEDERDTKIWFLDHSYLENMYAMFKKVNGALSKDSIALLPLVK